MKCLIIDIVDSVIETELSRYMQVDTVPVPNSAELAGMIPGYDILVMRVVPGITREVLDAADSLKVIAVCSVGLNHIDLEYAKQKGINVFNAPGLNGNAVAELTISKMLDLSRNTMAANYDVKVNHNWDKYKFVGWELRGRTLGIIGFGRIGRRVAELARVFGMQVLAYDPYLKAEDFAAGQAKGVSLDELLQQSDYVTTHVPLTAETKNIIDARALSLMKPDGVVLNMSRGGVVNEKDICQALREGRIAGYASDVLENELAGGGTNESSFVSPLFELDNFIVSPHIGAQSVDAQRDIGVYIVGKIRQAVGC